MNHTIEDIEINQELSEQEITLTNGLMFFPENYVTAKSIDDFIFTDELPDIRKTFKKNGIEIPTLGGQPERLRGRKNADWFGPAIFFSLSLVTENPTIVSISLNVLSNYITDFFKGISGEKRVNLEIYVEKKGKKKYKRINYKGSPEGLKDLEKIIKSLD